MATTYHGGGSQSPTSLSKPIERVFEDAQHTGEILLSNRKLRDYPKIAAKYDLVDTICADLSKNRLSEVPKEICQYLSMEKVNCYHNVLKVIPEAMIQLQSLTYLNLRAKQMCLSVINEFPALTGIKPVQDYIAVLQITRNQLSIIPVFISQMQALEVLIASNNRLVSLPEEIGVLDKLMELDVSCNEISHLPLQIGDLKSLKSLNVRRNFLQELPVEISKLNLRRLDISANRISKIPTLFRKIETLEDIILEYNPLTLPPAHICIKGMKHIMKYLQTEATREEKKRGILNEQEMKRFRKSLPPQQSVSSEEFRNLMESPDKWKRHTVLSSDSGYSTADSIEKSWSPQETNSDPQHLIDSNTQVAKAILSAKDQRVFNGRALPPEPPQRVSSRQSPDRMVTTETIAPKPSPPVTLPTSQYRNPPAPPTLYPASPQTPLTPPTPQGPGPGVGDSLAQGSVGLSQEDVFTRELQRQKQEYESQKKVAAQLRQQQEEEDEREQRRRAAQRIQDEQRAMLERQRGEAARAQEEARQWEENRQRELEETRRQDEVQQREEARRLEEAKRTEEAQRAEESHRQQEEAKLHKPHNNFYNHTYNNNKSPDWPPPPPNLTNQHEALTHPELSHHNSYGPHSPSQYGAQRSSSLGQHSPQNPNLHSPTSPSQYQQFSPGPYGDRLGAPGMAQHAAPASPYSHRSPNDHLTQSPYGHHQNPRPYSPYSPYSSSSHSPRGHYQSSPTSPQSDQTRVTSPGHMDPTSDTNQYGRFASQHGGSEHDPYNSMPLDPYAGYRKPSLSASNSFKEERRPAAATQHYRRTVSDSNQRLPVHQNTGASTSQLPMAMTNGPIEEQPSVNGSTPTNQSTDTSPNTSFSSQHSTPSHKSPHVINGPTSSGDTPPETAPRKPRTTTGGPSSMTSRVAKPTADRAGRTTTTTGLTKTGVPTARKTNLMQNEEIRKSQQNLKGLAGPTERLKAIQKEATSKYLNRGPAGPTDRQKAVIEQRLKTIQKEATRKYLNRRSTGSNSSEDGKRSTPSRSLAYQTTTSSAASKRSGTVMTTAHVKMLEDYNKEGGGPGYAMRRDNSEQMEKLRKTISTRLKRSLPENLSEALSDGVLLCHLANQIRPRSVASVHVPSPAVPKLTLAKCRRNVENFLEACRKIGVPKEQICGSGDILEEKGIGKVAATVSALVAMATQSKHTPATNV